MMSGLGGLTIALAAGLGIAACGTAAQPPGAALAASSSGVASSGVKPVKDPTPPASHTPGAATRPGSNAASSHAPRPVRHLSPGGRPAPARVPRLTAAGNPDGHALVPAAARPVDSSHPSRVIGNGTAASCTSRAVVAAVAAGGVITFSCGPRPVTIMMRATAKVRNTSAQVVIDGGGKVTLSGGGAR